MSLSAEQRRALAMLSTSGHNGATQPFLVAHGFGGAMLTGASQPRPRAFSARIESGRIPKELSMSESGGIDSIRGEQCRSLIRTTCVCG
jgi:hypothetical protein